MNHIQQRYKTKLSKSKSGIFQNVFAGINLAELTRVRLNPMAARGGWETLVTNYRAGLGFLGRHPRANLGTGNPGCHLGL